MRVCVGDHPGMPEDLGTGLPRWAGRTLFCGWWRVGTYDSVGGLDEMPGGAPPENEMPGGAPPEDEFGGQPTSPLTAVLPDAATRLWTTVAATDAEVSTG